MTEDIVWVGSVVRQVVQIAELLASSKAVLSASGGLNDYCTEL